MTAPRPRLGGLDLPWAEGLADFCARARGDLAAELAAAPERAGPVDFVLLGNYCKDLGLVRYALGAPLPEIRGLLLEAARAFERVFALRGTAPAFEVNVLEPTAELGLRAGRPLHPPGTADESLANSRRGLEAMHLALAGGDSALARAIAPLVEDPPDAAYLGPDSEVATPVDQRLAYALRDLLLEKPPAEVALDPGAPPAVLLEAAALEALAARQGEAFAGALRRRVEEHEREARREASRHRPETFLCLPGFGLAALALERRVATRGELPGDSVYLPLDLLDLPAPAA